MRLHVGARSWLIHRTIAKLEEDLDPALFLRVHRSVILRRDTITGLYRDEAGHWTARLTDGGEQRIGRSYVDEVKRFAGTLIRLRQRRLEPPPSASAQLLPSRLQGRNKGRRRWGTAASQWSLAALVGSEGSAAHSRPDDRRENGARAAGPPRRTGAEPRWRLRGSPRSPLSTSCAPFRRMRGRFDEAPPPARPRRARRLDSTPGNHSCTSVPYWDGPKSGGRGARRMDYPTPSRASFRAESGHGVGRSDRRKTKRGRGRGLPRGRRSPCSFRSPPAFPPPSPRRPSCS